MPTHYAIDLELNPETLKVDGFEVIDIEVREPTARLVLNADEIRITRATVDRSRAAPRSRMTTTTKPSPSPFRVRSRSAITSCASPSPRKSTAAAPASTTSTIRTDGVSKRLISSHLAPADARRVFPVWDEPSFKATFALTVTVPRNYTAVSNMPVEREEPAGPNAKKISFMTTPKMSSYLVELTAGELEQISGEVDGVAINVFTTAGKREQGRFALQSTIDLLRYFNDYFGLKYPLPKLDLIAIPNGSRQRHGALGRHHVP